MGWNKKGRGLQKKSWNRTRREWPESETECPAGSQKSSVLVRGVSWWGSGRVMLVDWWGVSG